MISPNAKVGQNTKIWNPELSNIQDCEIGEDCKIHSNVWIGNGVKIGNRVKIQAFTFIPTGVTIEDDVFIGPGVTFTNDKHPPSGSQNWKETTIKSGASLGARVTCLPGITVGQGARIGAGSVITKDIPDSVVACGVPARVMAGKK